MLPLKIIIVLLFLQHKQDAAAGLEALKYLQCKGANLKAQSKDGSTVLHFAAQNKALSIVEYLITNDLVGKTTYFDFFT